MECDYQTKKGKADYCSLNGKVCSEANCEEGLWKKDAVKAVRPPRPETEILKVFMPPKMTSMLADRAKEMLFPNKQLYARTLVARDLASAGDMSNIEIIPKSEPFFITIEVGLREQMEKRAVQLGLRNIGEYFRFILFTDLDIGGYLEFSPSEEIKRRIRK